MTQSLGRSLQRTRGYEVAARPAGHSERVAQIELYCMHHDMDDDRQAFMPAHAHMTTRRARQRLSRRPHAAAKLAGQMHPQPDSKSTQRACLLTPL
jgi:hypothetical protein